MHHDHLLFREISVQADRAQAIRPKSIRLKAIAESLHARFPHHSPSEIERQCELVWRDRHLGWE